MINNDTAVFLSAVTIRTSHYTHNYVVRGRGSYQAFHGCMVSSAKEIQSKQFFFGLPGELFLVEWTVKGKQNVL